MIEVGLALLAHASTCLKYCDEAFLAANYLTNRLPTKVLEFSTPLEMFFQEKPNYVGLHTFGCACWPNLHPFQHTQIPILFKTVCLLRV
jgi:hypothetical protein